MKRATIIVKTKRSSDRIELPQYKTVGAAGLDVAAWESLLLRPGAIVAVSTGLFLEVPEGYECQVRPRSGLALKHGVTVLNTPGTIDSDYRGEVKVIMINHGRENFVITAGDRIAQLVFAPVVKAMMIGVDQLSETERSSDGFGSTGV